MKTEKHSTRRSGLTLVEVIVVVAVIVLVLGIAVPGIVSLASLGRGDFGNSARNLLGALRAAKMYSATYRSITAVAYVYTEVDDSVLFLGPGVPANVHIIDGFALVRKPLDRQDALALAESWITDPQFNTAQLTSVHPTAPSTFQGQREYFADFFIDENIYFALQDKEGQFREFGRDAVILNAVPKTLEAITLADVTASAEQHGLLGIRVIAPWSDFIPPGGDGIPDLVGQPAFEDVTGDDIPDFTGPTNAGYLNDTPGYLNGTAVVDTSVYAQYTLFPAHVFAPTGRILMPAAAPERVILEVGPSPALADSYRFGRDLTSTESMAPFEADESGDPLAQAELSIGRRFLEPILIELYQSTGRVKFASKGM